MDEIKINDDQNKKINERLKEDLAHYRQSLHFLGCNVPIGVLCLPSTIEKILLDGGYLRVYDLLRGDFIKIKGLGKRRLDILRSRLDEFLTM